MSTVIPGLIKIGKTKTENYESRMYELERNGYRNATGLERRFAIEVEKYDEKERLLHEVFAKSRVGNTELFAIDINTAIQLMAAMEGKLIYPVTEEKGEVFDEASESSKSKDIPDGDYKLERKNKSNESITAFARVQNGYWTLIKGSVLGLKEGKGLQRKVRDEREKMPINQHGELTADYDLGECSPSFASDIVLNSSSNGWCMWKNKEGNIIDIYRIREIDE